MKYFLPLIALAGMAACSPAPTKDGCHPENWTCRSRYERTVGENIDACVNKKLDHMSDADHTAAWSAELVRELHAVCAKMYPYGVDSSRSVSGRASVTLVNDASTPVFIDATATARPR